MARGPRKAKADVSMGGFEETLARKKRQAKGPKSKRKVRKRLGRVARFCGVPVPFDLGHRFAHRLVVDDL